MKKTIVIVLLMIFALLPLFAGGRNQQSRGATGATAVTAARGQFPLTSTKAELTVLIVKPAYVSDLNTNLAAKWYEDYTNVHVTYIHTRLMKVRGPRPTCSLPRGNTLTSL